LKAGETIQITTSYSGKDVVLDMGNGNYYLRSRESWCPNVRGELGNYAQYSMTFHTAKSVQLVATGNRVTEKEEGQQKISVWQTLTPIAVAGFNMGQFKSDQSERNKDVQVVTYANTSLADNYSGLPNARGMVLGTLSTTGMLKVATSEGDAAIQIYTDFFGPLPYDHVSLTQQTACNYGQSWPTLVYLPICYFWDSTIQHQLGLLDSDPSYWKVVTAHEVAHQWWGQTVGFGSYRDQWMSEGFADFSASLFLMETRKDQKEYRDFWALLRKRLLEKNAQGVRPVDVGPVVMGSRVSTSRSGGDVYQMLIYPKGAYILHTLEMLFWTSKYGEAPFKAAMHDFVKSYQNKAATTEDFKAVMERDMPPWMDVEKNHKLDWFFNAYVYGTEVPKYTMTSTFDKKGDETTVHFALTQSGVSDDFTMMVPVYIEFADKRVMLLGHATMKGSRTIEQTINLGKLTSEPKRMVANYNFDLLSD
jgi:aminopeptidase N